MINFNPQAVQSFQSAGLNNPQAFAIATQAYISSRGVDTTETDVNPQYAALNQAAGFVSPDGGNTEIFDPQQANPEVPQAPTQTSTPCANNSCPAQTQSQPHHHHHHRHEHDAFSPSSGFAGFGGGLDSSFVSSLGLGGFQGLASPETFGGFGNAGVLGQGFGPGAFGSLNSFF